MAKVVKVVKVVKGGQSGQLVMCTSCGLTRNSRHFKKEVCRFRSHPFPGNSRKVQVQNLDLASGTLQHYLKCSLPAWQWLSPGALWPTVVKNPGLTTLIPAL